MISESCDFTAHMPHPIVISLASADHNPMRIPVSQTSKLSSESCVISPSDTTPEWGMEHGPTRLDPSPGPSV